MRTSREANDVQHLTFIPQLHRATHAVALRISELHERFGHRRSTLTSVLDRLEQRALITRKNDPTDRRSFVVSVTKKGRPAAAAVHRALLELERAALAGLSEARRTQLKEALDAFATVTTDAARP